MSCCWGRAFAERPAFREELDLHQIGHARLIDFIPSAIQSCQRGVRGVPLLQTAGPPPWATSIKGFLSSRLSAARRG